MTMPSALEISRQAPLKPIADIAEAMGIPPEMVELYGEYVAKIGLNAVEALAGRPRGRYVVVTAVTPTPLGEGKTTAAVGLGRRCITSAGPRRSRSARGRWAPRSGSRGAPRAAVTAR